ncbi:MAG: glutamate--tRNA ligase [Deltaproteobacteria bacterium]|nr:MAG: glutamate--tRNA ligase [Deltaproteobacteria bacterium]
MKRVRVRFAPSPTGMLHIGNARTALYNKLFALKHDGAFILRIEDTDVARLDLGAERAIMEDLRWLGLDWDEGPEVGGRYGPYLQSERGNIYQEYAQRLLEKGKVYPCYCTPEELEQMRKMLLAKGERPRYLGRCRELSPTMARELEREGRRPSLRFKVPEGTTVVEDIIHGAKTFENSLIGDFVIMRSDGRPAYNFAAVVDDALMEITHVIRGEDHLPNTPRQLLLYQALGFAPPHFAHHPMLLGPDGTRLSKRHGATSVQAYREEGFLPQAMANYLVLLGGGSSGGGEVMSWEEMIERFSLEEIARSPAIFDLGKLRWLNRVHIHKMEPEDLLQHARPFLQDFPLEGVKEGWLAQVMDVIKENITTLAEVGLYLPIFLPGKIPKDEKAKAALAENGALKVIKTMEEVVRDLPEVDEKNLPFIFSKLQARTALKGKSLFFPIRAALTGKMEGPELRNILPLLGKEVILERLKEVLGGS